MDDRISQVVNQLKQDKSNQLTYYQARENLLKAGYKPDEIDQASQQFIYSDAPPDDGQNGLKLNDGDAGLIGQDILKDQGLDSLSIGKKDLNSAFFKSQIPFFGPLYRPMYYYRLVSYEATKTGKSKSKVLMLMAFIDVVTLLMMFLLAVLFSVLKLPAITIFAAPIIGLLVGLVLFKTIFRPKK